MLIGLTGPSGSRKTLAAKRLERRHGFARLHAGAPVKKGVRRGFGLGRKDVDGARKDKPNLRLAGATARVVLEAFGSGLHAVAPKATAAQLRRRIGKLAAEGRDVVVDGVRSPVEAAALRAMGGAIWRADNGTTPDRALPTDDLQQKIAADRTIDTQGAKKEVRGRVDTALLEALGPA